MINTLATISLSPQNNPVRRGIILSIGEETKAQRACDWSR